jgi:membrane protease YdiL (CAAX protease family)
MTPPVPRTLPAAALAELAGIALLLRLAAAYDPPWLPSIAFASALFLYVPLFHCRGQALPGWATATGSRRTAAGTLLAAALLGASVYFLWLRLPLPGGLRPGPAPPIPRPGWFLLRQLLVAGSEETFFRGYLYDAFERRGWKPVLPTSLLFAATHLAIAPSPWRAMTFFPALLFGEARRRTGGVPVPALLHFAFNLLPAFFGG